MSRVLSPLDLRYLDGDRWLLLQPFVVVSDVLGRIEIPAGFVTDFNSTPRILWNLIPPTEYGEAALPHDFLYQRGKLQGIAVSRADADRVHQEFVAWVGSSDCPPQPKRTPAPKWKRDAFHYGLRLLAWWTWSSYRKHDVAAV